MAIDGVQGAPDLVSVVIPAYNTQETIAETLRSVLTQSYTRLEVIVVDDGSSDSTPTIVRRVAAADARVRLLSQRNMGVAHARNAGLEVARGDHVALVDADDVWHPRKIELQMEVAVRHGPRLGFVYAWSRRIDAQGHVTNDEAQARHRGDVFAQLLAFNFIGNASVAFMRRDRVLAAGGFDPSLQAAGAQGAEDVKLYLAIAERAIADVVPLFLTGYRGVPGSMSSAAERMMRSVRLVLEEIRHSRPDLPAGLFDLSFVHYEIYGAALALARGDYWPFARSATSALRRAPDLAAAHLAVAALWRVRERVIGAGGRRLFFDLAPDEPAFRRPLADWMERRRAAAVGRCLCA